MRDNKSASCSFHITFPKACFGFKLQMKVLDKIPPLSDEVIVTFWKIFHCLKQRFCNNKLYLCVRMKTLEDVKDIVISYKGVIYRAFMFEQLFRFCTYIVSS